VTSSRCSGETPSRPVDASGAVVAADREQARERVLAVLYELPGPDGFRGPRAAKVTYEDALDELASSDGPISDDVARRAYQERVRERALRRGGR
jgi:hypothetical protein